MKQVPLNSSVRQAIHTGVPMTDPSLTQDRAFRLDGRHALVTGGASGIGEATVCELVRAGAFVWIADISVPAAEALANATGSAQAIHLDVTSPDSIAAAVARITRLDILVNNAGIGHVGSIAATEPEDFDRLFNVNVRAVYLVTRAFLAAYSSPPGEHAAAPRGAIVNIASVAGLVGIKPALRLLRNQGRGRRHDSPARGRISQNPPRQRHLSRHRGNALRRGLPRKVPQAQ